MKAINWAAHWWNTASDMRGLARGTEMRGDTHRVPELRSAVADAERYARTWDAEDAEEDAAYAKRWDDAGQEYEDRKESGY